MGDFLFLSTIYGLAFADNGSSGRAMLPSD
jgi:hypothetical protein